VGRGPVERDVERRRMGPHGRQLRGSSRDEQWSMTREVGEARGEADRWIPAIVPWFQYRFKSGKLIQTRSNIYKKISNLVQSKKDLSKLKQFEIKYNFEGFNERNNFPYMNSLRLEMDLELKIWESKV
jgi:hypothetical protein